MASNPRGFGGASGTPWLLGLGMLAGAGISLALSGPGAGGFRPESVAQGCFLIWACAMVTLTGPLTPRSWLREFLLGPVLAGGLAWALGGFGGSASQGALLVAVVVFSLWGIAMPLRAARWGGLGALVGLGLATWCLATPFLLSRGSGAVSSWVADRNALLGLHLTVWGEDWFHAPRIYPRVGEAYYRAPALAALLAPMLLAALLGLLAGWWVVRKPIESSVD